MTIGGRSSVATPARRRRLPAAPPASPVTSFLETFPNDGVMDVTAEDLTWIFSSGQIPVVASGQCTTGASFGASARARAQHDTTSIDQYVQCDWITAAANDEIFLMAREDTAGGTDPDSDNAFYMFVYYDGSGVTVTLQDWQTGDYFDNQNFLETPFATWRLEVEGTAIRGYRDGVLKVSGDTTGYTAAGTRAGFEIDSGSGHPVIDNFEFGNL